MTLTHRLALTAMFASAAAFAQTSSPNTSTTSKYDPTRASPSSTSSASTPSSTHDMAKSEATKSAVKMSPSAVLSMIHQVNLDEIKMGKTAETKAQNDKVKSFAKDMVDDHTALDRKLTDFVKDEGNGKLTLSSSQIPASKHKELTHMTKEAEHKLSSATGATFDRDYAKAMLKGHEAVLSDLDAALPSLESNAKVHDLVSDARDKIKEHRDHARDLVKDLEGTSATGGSGMQGSGSMTGRHDTTPQSVGGGATGSTTGTRATDSTTVTPPNPGTTSPSATPPPAASTPSGSSGR